MTKNAVGYPITIVVMNRRSFFHLFSIVGLTAKTRASSVTAAPPVPPIVLQRSPVRGFRHRQPREFLKHLKPGAPLTLRAEPANPHDRHAVMVLWKDRHLGYLPREDNSHASRLLRQGIHLQATVMENHPERYEWEPLRIEVSFTQVQLQVL